MQSLDFFVARDRNLHQTSLSIQRIDWSVGQRIDPWMKSWERGYSGTRSWNEGVDVLRIFFFHLWCRWVSLYTCQGRCLTEAANLHILSAFDPKGQKFFFSTSQLKKILVWFLLAQCRLHFHPCINHCDQKNALLYVPGLS